VVESGGPILRTLVRNEFCVSLMATPGCVDTMTNDPKNLIAPAPAIHAPLTPQSDADWERMAAQLLELLILHDQHSARALVIDAADNGVPFTEIYLKLIQPVMYRIGELWECGSLDVAQEHYATAVIEMILAHLEPEIFGDFVAIDSQSRLCNNRRMFRANRLPVGIRTMSQRVLARLPSEVRYEPRGVLWLINWTSRP
jgi:B12 binding protein